jgi:hypothetical protein
VLALEVRHLELGILAALTAVLAANAAPRCAPASVPGLPAPSPETVAIRIQETASIACDEPGIQTIVFAGRVRSFDPALSTMHFRFAEMPSGYSVMTGSTGEFEVRIPRNEMGVTDLCALPTAGLRNSAFKDAQLSIEYVVQFER